MQRVSEWLETLGLGKYAPVFEAHEIDLDVLPELTDADLQELGLPIGPPRRILKAARAVATEGDASGAGSPESPGPAPRTHAPECHQEQSQERRAQSVEGWADLAVDLVSAGEDAAGNKYRQRAQHRGDECGQPVALFLLVFRRFLWRWSVATAHMHGGLQRFRQNQKLRPHWQP